MPSTRSLVTIAVSAWVIVIGSIVYEETVHPKRCALYEQYTRQISDTVDGPFKPRTYVRCMEYTR